MGAAPDAGSCSRTAFPANQSGTQRHGLNQCLVPTRPVPDRGGMTEADFALRVEVHAVDALDRARAGSGRS